MCIFYQLCIVLMILYFTEFRAQLPLNKSELFLDQLAFSIKVYFESLHISNKAYFESWHISNKACFESLHISNKAYYKSLHIRYQTTEARHILNPYIYQTRHILNPWYLKKFLFWIPAISNKVYNESSLSQTAQIQIEYYRINCQAILYSIDWLKGQNQRVPQSHASVLLHNYNLLKFFTTQTKFLNYSKRGRHYRS